MSSLSTHCPQKPRYLLTTHVAAFIKLQRYSLLPYNQTLNFDHTNLYLSWMFHTARSVTDKSCLVCHDRRSAPHLMFPLGNTTECLAHPYTEDFLCPTICLLGSMSATLGPDWIHNVSSFCLYQPMHTDACPFACAPLLVSILWATYPIAVMSLSLQMISPSPRSLQSGPLTRPYPSLYLIWHLAPWG